MSKKIHEMTAEELGLLFPINLLDSRKEWKGEFDKEKVIIEKILNEDVLRIEHIGSTAIPGIKAKPTIDILVQIRHTADLEKIIKNMKSAGYEYTERPENPPPHIMFMRGYSTDGFKGQAVHVHVRFSGDWDEIYFRDYLNIHRETAKQYEQLKIELEKKYKYNREDYTAGKTEFVKRISNIARKELKKGKV